MRPVNVVGMILLFAASTLASAPAVAQGAAPGRGMVGVVIATNYGTFTADLDSAHAPISVTNFLRYVDAGAYRNGRFHRTVRPDNQPNDSVRIGVIQGGPNADAPSFPPIALERTSVTGLHHQNGTLSMARAGPNTATSDFFVCIGDQPALDFGGHRNLDGQGFAAFGRVTSGMDVVRKIQSAPAAAQQLTPPVAILAIRRAGAR